MGYYVYMLECQDGTFYTGWTVDLQKRVKSHNQGKGAKYTRGRCPVFLRYFEEFPNKEEAMQREWAIKQLSRAAKLELIKSGKIDF